MKVSEASDEDLNRFIAEILDPLSKHYALGPRDFIHSGDGLKTLLIWLLKHEYDISGCGEKTLVIDDSDRDPEHNISRNTDDIGRAVAEAFALANGWKE